MASAGEFHRLQHCLQFRVITDTKQTVSFLFLNFTKDFGTIKYFFIVLFREICSEFVLYLFYRTYLTEKF